MNTIEKQKLENHKKKLVSNARAIISNQVGLPVGLLKMNKIISWLEDISELNNIDLEFFKTIYESISHLPLSVERLGYNTKYLKEQDRVLNKILLENYDQILDKCSEIIAKLSDEKKQA